MMHIEINSPFVSLYAENFTQGVEGLHTGTAILQGQIFQRGYRPITDALFLIPQRDIKIGMFGNTDHHRIGVKRLCLRLIRIIPCHQCQLFDDSFSDIRTQGCQTAHRIFEKGSFGVESDFLSGGWIRQLQI